MGRRSVSLKTLKIICSPSHTKIDKQAGAELGQAQVSYKLDLWALLTAAVTVLKLCLSNQVFKIQLVKLDWLNQVDEIKLIKNQFQQLQGGWVAGGMGIKTKLSLSLA